LHRGQWIDRRFTIAPVFLYLGAGVGAIGGMKALSRR